MKTTENSQGQGAGNHRGTKLGRVSLLPPEQLESGLYYLPPTTRQPQFKLGGQKPDANDSRRDDPPIGRHRCLPNGCVGA